MHLVAPPISRAEGIPIGVVQLMNRLAEHHAPTYDHSFAVAGLARALSLQLGIEPNTRSEIVLAGLVHDIGKVSLDELLLDAPRALTSIERERVIRHPARGARLLRRRGEYGLATIVEAQRERFDGSGLHAMRGKHIPLATRIVAVANAFEGLVSGRPYRPGLSAEGALAVVRHRSGTEFDPDVVAALERRERTRPLPERGYTP